MSPKHCLPTPFFSSASFFLSLSLSLSFFLCLFPPFLLVLYFLFPRSRQTLMVIVGGTSAEVVVGKPSDCGTSGLRVLSAFSPSCSPTDSQAKSHKRLTPVPLPSILSRQQIGYKPDKAPSGVRSWIPFLGHHSVSLRLL